MSQKYLTNERMRTIFGIVLYTLMIAVPVIVAAHYFNLAVGIAVGVVWGLGLNLAKPNEILNFGLESIGEDE